MEMSRPRRTDRAGSKSPYQKPHLKRDFLITSPAKAQSPEEPAQDNPIRNPQEELRTRAAMANALAMTPLLGAKCATTSRPSSTFSGRALRTARVQVVAWAVRGG